MLFIIQFRLETLFIPPVSWTPTHLEIYPWSLLPTGPNSAPGMQPSGGPCVPTRMYTPTCCQWVSFLEMDQFHLHDNVPHLLDDMLKFIHHIMSLCRFYFAMHPPLKIGKQAMKRVGHTQMQQDSTVGLTLVLMFPLGRGFFCNVINVVVILCFMVSCIMLFIYVYFYVYLL